MATAKEVERRIAGERAVIRKAVRLLKSKGWQPVRVWDGECNVRTTNEIEVIDAVFSVDESTVRFSHPNHAGTHCFCVVLGNSPSECISDASMGEGWDEAMQLVWDHLDTVAEREAA